MGRPGDMVSYEHACKLYLVALSYLDFERDLRFLDLEGEGDRLPRDGELK